MYDTLRWILLGLFFISLFGVWFWSRHQASRQGLLGSHLGASFRILEKRWVDQRTGICLIESEEQTFLLAYTVGGSVSWQAVPKTTSEPEMMEEKTFNRLNPPKSFPDTEFQ